MRQFDTHVRARLALDDLERQTQEALEACQLARLDDPQLPRLRDALLRAIDAEEGFRAGSPRPESEPEEFRSRCRALLRVLR